MKKLSELKWETLIDVQLKGCTKDQSLFIKPFFVCAKPSCNAIIFTAQKNKQTKKSNLLHVWLQKKYWCVRNSKESVAGTESQLQHITQQLAEVKVWLLY